MLIKDQRYQFQIIKGFTSCWLRVQSQEPESGFKSYLYHCSRLKMATNFLTLFSWRDEGYAPPFESEMTMWQLSPRNIKVTLSQFLTQALKTDSFHFLCLTALKHHVKFNYTAAETSHMESPETAGGERGGQLIPALQTSHQRMWVKCTVATSWTRANHRNQY